MNTVLQQNWQIYAMAVIVGFATVMVMRWWRYRRASGGGDSALLSIVLNNMTQVSFCLMPTSVFSSATIVTSRCTAFRQMS